MRRTRSIADIAVTVAIALGLTLGAVSLTFAQIATTGQIVGTVQDQSGAVIPGVEVQLQNEETKAIQTATASTDGGFVFPTVLPGSYTLTATKQGFETTSYKGLIVYAARTTNQTVTLKVGAVNQIVEVQGGAQLLHTTTTTISDTVDQKYLQDLPLTGRDTLPFALLQAGAQQGVNSRDSTFNGLPGGAINITLNGIANNAQRFKSGGTSFFAFVTPRLEAVQEVTVATSNLGANSTGQGAIQIQYVIKSGTNAFHGEVFWQHENSALKANNWFNNTRNIRRPVFIRNDQGGALGGPIIKDKLFFFLSYAHVKTPQSMEYEARVLAPDAQRGIFTYIGNDPDRTQHSVNLLDIARMNGFPSTVNPIIAAQLQKIQSSTSAGAVSPLDMFRNRVRWVAPSPVTNQFPGARIDYQVTEKLRLSVSDFYNRNVNDRGFRGTVLPGIFTTEQSVGQISNPYITNTSATWTLRPNMINEFNFGIQGTQEIFNIGYDRSLFQPRLMEFPLDLPSGLEAENNQGFGITSQLRNNPVYNLADNFFYQRGNHTFSFGGNYIRSSVYVNMLEDAGIPRFNFGVVSNDPVNAIFNNDTLPFIPNDARNDALALYALLTGRISSVTKSVNVDEKTKQYVVDQPVTIRERQTSFGLYFQDSWRVNRALTLNYGLRWDFQGDIFNTNDIYTSPTLLDIFGPSGLAQGGGDTSPNLFNPGSLLGIANPNIYQRSHAYSRDFANPGPHLGIAWNPSFQNGLLGRVFGDRKTVFRGGYSISYYSEGMLNFTNSAGDNPGLRQSGNLVPGVDFEAGQLSLGDPLPAFNLFPNSFGSPLALSNFAFATDTTISTTDTDTTISTIDPKIRAPYVQTWSASIQREFGQGSVLEVRYAGNRGVRLWHMYNINEVNIFENGFLKQFQDAQRNLAINMANGRTGFANNGLPGQVAMPIFDVAFAGVAPNLSFESGNFINLLQTGQAGALANNIASTSTYFCRLVGNGFGPCANLGFNTSGQYPINLFQLNPFLGTANVLSDNSSSNYNGLQIEFRQRLSHGLTMNANYTFSHAMNDRYNKNVDNIGNFATLRNRRLDYGPSTFDIRHVFQAFGTYDLPVGQSRKFSLRNPVLNGVIGGWTVGTIFRMQSGLPFKLSSGRMTVNQSDSGVILNGVTASDLQKMVGVFKSGPDVYFLDPRLAGSGGQANSSFLSPPTIPGQFGAFVYLYGPKFVTADLSLAKAMPLIKERLRMEIRAEMVNAFNHPIFQVPTGGTFNVTPVSITATSFGRTTTTTTVPRQVQFRVRFTF
jgi:hypothetical protein